MKTDREAAQDHWDEINRFIKGYARTMKKPSVSVRCINCKTKKLVTVEEINNGLIRCKYRGLSTTCPDNL